MFVNIELPPASKVARTDEVLREVEGMVRETPGVAGVVSIGGFSILSGANQPNNATCIVILDDWAERTTPELSIDGIVGAIGVRISQIPEAIAFPFTPPPVQGRGASGGFDIRIQDRANVGLDVLETVTRDVVDAARQSPEIANPFTGFSTATPQLYLDIDRVKAQRLGVPLNTIFGTLSANLGSSYVNDFNAFGRTYQVRVQAEPEFRQSKEDILLLKVRNRDGATLPLSTVASVEERVAPTTVYRYNLYPAATITGDPGPGRATGQSMNAMQGIAETTLPSGFGYEWTGTAFQQKEAGNVVPIVFGLALIFVYLFLAAQYESWALPVTIMATIPIGIAGALLATMLRSMDNNVYTQIGLVLMIALVCKNAILIVEFAEQLRGQGRKMLDAVVEASALRFRPILMTALSFVLGTLPLLIAAGAGANSRQSIGTAVFGGMILATIVGLVFTPMGYALIRKIFKGKVREG